MNLSCVHLCYALIRIFELSTQIASYQPTTIQIVTVTFLKYSIATSYPLHMHFMTLDRFFEVYFHLRYPLIFTRRLVLGVLALIWGLSCTSGGYVAYLRHTNEARLIITPLSGQVLITFVIAYGYLYFKWRSFCTKTIGGKGSGHFRIPVLIILTFIFFELAGNTLNLVQRSVPLTSIQKGCIECLVLALYSFGGMSDVVIYVVVKRSSLRKNTVHTTPETFRRIENREGQIRNPRRGVFTRKNTQNMDTLRSTTPVICRTLNPPHRVWLPLQNIEEKCNQGL